MYQEARSNLFQYKVEWPGQNTNKKIIANINDPIQSWWLKSCPAYINSCWWMLTRLRHTAVCKIVFCCKSTDYLWGDIESCISFFSETHPSFSHFYLKATN